MFGQIAHILATRGRPVRPLVDFVIRDDGDGPYLKEWDEAALGPRPTREEIAAVTTQQAATATSDDQAQQVMKRDTVAALLVYHERERYRDANGRYPTPAELAPIMVTARAQFMAILKTLG